MTQSDGEPLKKRGKKTISGQTKATEYEIELMQILRSQGLTLREISKQVGYAPTTIKKYTHTVRFPRGTDFNISSVIRQIIMKTVIDAYRDGGKDKRDFAITVEKYLGALKTIEDLRIDISIRDEQLTLEKIMTEEDLPQEALEKLQARYDKNREELG